VRIPIKFRPKRHINVRSRPGRRKWIKRNSNKSELNHITTATGPNVVKFNMTNMDNLKRSPRGVALRTSKRWVGPSSLRAVSQRIELPLIDRLGRYTGCNIYYTSCMSREGYISTVISTIFQRLMSYSRRRNGQRETNIRQSILLRVAAYYAMSKNTYFMDRVIYLLKNLKSTWKILSRITHSFSFKLDANKRFVYSHVCFQTQWFTFRAVKPRDKSRIPNSYTREFPSGWVSENFQYDCIWHVFNNMHRI
jgi:hypothetical protein